MVTVFPLWRRTPSSVLLFQFSKKLWISFPNKTFVFPGSFLRSKVLPLHFNLGDGSFPEHDFPPVDYTVWLDQKLPVWFYLQKINLC